MSDISNNSNQQDQYDENGNKPNDFTDGMAITALIMIAVSGIIFWLNAMP